MLACSRRYLYNMFQYVPQLYDQATLRQWSIISEVLARVDLAAGGSSPDAEEDAAEASPRGASPLPAAALAAPMPDSIVEFRMPAMVSLAALAKPLGSFAVEFPQPIIVITGSNLQAQAVAVQGHGKATQTSNDMFFKQFSFMHDSLYRIVSWVGSQQ